MHSSGFEWLSRAGFVARGLIYGIIGVLALRLALGHGGRTTNQQGALQTVAHQPLGKVLLALLAVGLGGYALWRFARAAIGHGPEGTDSPLDRVTALASGIVYLGLLRRRGPHPDRLERQLEHPEPRPRQAYSGGRPGPGSSEQPA